MDKERSVGGIEYELRSFLSGRCLPEKAMPDEESIQDICAVFNRNNQIARIVNSPRFTAVTQREKGIINGGDYSEGKECIKMGAILCIDGRFMIIVPLGRAISPWEEVAGVIDVYQRKSDKLLLPQSPQFSETIRLTAESGVELLELNFAHTSFLTDHTCGGMKQYQSEGGLVLPGESLEMANIRRINEANIPSIDNLVRMFRRKKGFNPLARTGVSLLFDTDTFGSILNYNPEDKKHQLSSTVLTEKYRKDIGRVITEWANVRGKYHFLGDYGMFRDRFTNPGELIGLTERTVSVADLIMTSPMLVRLKDEILSGINYSYADLTANQSRALNYFFARTVALQYLTGLSSVTEKPDHPFAHHGEKHMTMSLYGKPLGQLDCEEQVFASTPSDLASAVKHLKTKLSLMEHNEHHKGKLILFLSNPVNGEAYELDSESVQRSVGNLAGFYQDMMEELMKEKETRDLIENGELIIVPVLVDERTRGVLGVPDIAYRV